MSRVFLKSLLIPILQVLFDIITRSIWVSKGGSKWDWGFYSIALLASWGLSYVFVAATALVRSHSRCGAVGLAVAFSLLHAALLVANFFLFRFFGEYLFPSAIAYIQEDRHYIQDVLGQYGSLWTGACFFAAWGAAFLCLWPPIIHHRFPTWRLALSALAVLPVAVVALNHNTPHSEYRMPPDVVSAISLSKHFLRVQKNIWPLRPAERAQVRAVGNHRPGTVIVLLHESMGLRSLDFWPQLPPNVAPYSGMPRLAKRIGQDSASFALFPWAFANALATQVSMPSLFAGVSPEEGHRKLHRMPMLWDMAKAAGYRTGYFTAMRLRWAVMGDFLFKQPIDTLVSKESTNNPAVNDGGMDDFHNVQAITDFIENHPDEPLFIFWNTYALHTPYQSQSAFVDLSNIPGTNYEKALYHLDSALHTVILKLQSSGRWDETLLINTGDHGEDPEPLHPVARIKSFYDEFTRVPIWIKIPHSMQNSAEVQTLRAHLQSPISNVDIAPTLAHLWGIEPADSADVDLELVDGRLPWQGRSVFEPIPADRMITLFSNGDTRFWDGEGFGLVRDCWRLVLRPDSGIRLYNIIDDPFQMHNVWGTVSDTVWQPFIDHIKGNDWLQKVYHHYLALEAHPRVSAPTP